MSEMKGLKSKWGDDYLDIDVSAPKTCTIEKDTADENIDTCYESMKTKIINLQVVKPNEKAVSEEGKIMLAEAHKCFVQGNYKESSEVWQRAIELNPDSVAILFGSILVGVLNNQKENLHVSN